MTKLQGEGIHAGEVIHQPVPDLMAEYSEQTISLYGVTGTPLELLRMCPVSHENMTIEAQNMFLVMAMNESEIPIKEQHMPYFQEVTASRGVELKVTIQETPIISSESSKPVKESIMRTETPSERTGGVTAIIAMDLPVKRVAYDQTTLHQPLVRETISLQSSHDDDTEVTEVYVNESTTLRMDEWLSQLRIEYEVRRPDLLSVPEYELTEMMVSEVTVVPSSQSDSPKSIPTLTAKKMPIPQTKDSEVDFPLLAETESSIDVLAQDNLTLQDEETEDDLSVMDIYEEGLDQLIPAEELEAADVYNYDLNEDSVDKEVSAEYEKFLRDMNQDVQRPVFYSSDEMANTELQQKDLLSFVELMPNAEIGVSDIQPVNLMDKIAAYVEKNDTITEPAAEASTVLMAEINILTDELVSLNTKAEFQSPEVREELEVRLQEVCEELLEILEVESDDKLLAKFVLTIISEKTNQAMGTEIDEAIYDVLHERKTFTLHGLAVSLQAKLPSFQLLGRYALAR